MKKIRSSKKGFTLAELLIVVAIIGVLVGISIPIFSAQLQKSRLATNQANARAAYAAVSASILDQNVAGGSGVYTVATGTLNGGKATASDADVTATTAIKSWTVTSDMGGGELGKYVYNTWTVSIDADGDVSIEGAV